MARQEWVRTRRETSPTGVVTQRTSHTLPFLSFFFSQLLFVSIFYFLYFLYFLFNFEFFSFFLSGCPMRAPKNGITTTKKSNLQTSVLLCFLSFFALLVFPGVFMCVSNVSSIFHGLMCSCFSIFSYFLICSASVLFFFLGHFVLRFFFFSIFFFFFSFVSVAFNNSRHKVQRSRSAASRCYGIHGWVGIQGQRSPLSPKPSDSQHKGPVQIQSRHKAFLRDSRRRPSARDGFRAKMVHMSGVQKRRTEIHGKTLSVGAGAIKPNCLVLSVTNLTREDPCLSTHLVANLMPASAYNRCRSEPGTPRSAHSPLHAVSRCLRPSTIHS